MADFELRVNNKAFRNRGVEVSFDSSRYSALLDELVEQVPIEETPQVSITPAPVWGASKVREILYSVGRDDEAFPHSEYASTSKSLKIVVGEDAAFANKLLLSATRRWSGDLNGELDAHYLKEHGRRWYRRSFLAADIGAGAAIGYEAGGDQGIAIGAILGGLAYMAGGIGGSFLDPYYKTLRDFPKKPRIIAEYGQILGYTSA
jgi:hypothetical protein